jgi:hypothetical protein
MLHRLTFETSEDFDITLFFTPKGAMLSIGVDGRDPAVNIPLENLEIFVCEDKDDSLKSSKYAARLALNALEKRVDDWR